MHESFATFWAAVSVIGQTISPYIRRLLFWSVIIALLVTSYWLLILPADGFPGGETITVPSGLSVSAIAKGLATEHVLENPELFTLVLQLSGQSSRVRAGDYLFKSPEGLLVVAFRLVTGESGIVPVRITLPEGFTVRDMALAYAEQFPNITAERFITLGTPHEGYLFPDTYSFPPNLSVEKAVDAMLANFTARTASSSHSSEVVIMASILEKEAKGPTDMGIVSGILWKRLSLGMRLQVDAAPETYKTGGLPAAPISNPGLVALNAAANPTTTTYLYYLTGSDGQMHYAKTLAEHDANLAKYLK